MSAGGIGKMDPEETDGAQEDDDPFWNYQYSGYTDDYFNTKNSPVDYGGDLGMLGDSELGTLAVPVRDQNSPMNRPLREVLMTAEYPPQLSPALDSGYQSQTHGGHTQQQQQLQQQQNQYEMPMGQQQQQQQHHHQQQLQQQPMQASAMQQQHVQRQQQQTVHVQHQHIQPVSQPGPSQPQQQHVMQQQSGAQQIFVQQQAVSVPSSNVQFSYVPNGTTWTTVPGQQQMQQMPQQAVLVQSVNQMNGSAQYVIVNSQTSCANIVASGTPLVQQQQQRSVAIASMSGSGPNVTTMSGQPVVSSQTISSNFLPQEQQIILQSGSGCMTIPGSLPNGRIVQMATPINAQSVQQNQRVMQPIIQQTAPTNLQQLLSTTSTSHTPVAPAPAPMPQQQTPASSAKKRPTRKKTPAAAAPPPPAPKKPVEPIPTGGLEVKMDATDLMEMQQIGQEITRLEKLKDRDYTDQLVNLRNRQQGILLKMVPAALLMQTSASTPQQLTPIQKPPQQYQQPQSHSSTSSRQPKRPQSHQTPHRPPALIHSNHPSTSFESSQQQTHIYAQTQASSNSYSSSAKNSSTTVLQSVQYASTSQIKTQASYQPVVARGVEVVSSGGIYATSNVVSALTSQPGGGPVASCIITQQQQQQIQEQQQRLLAPKPEPVATASTPMKLPATATTSQQPQASPSPVVKLPQKHELALRIAQRAEMRRRRISSYFDEQRTTVDESKKVDVNARFGDISDVFRRLIPFATSYEPEVSKDTLDKFDHEHLRLTVHNSSRKRRLEERLNSVFLREARDPIENDIHLMYSLDKEYERRKLADDKELLASNPEQFASTSEYLPFAAQIKNAIEEQKKGFEANDELEKFKPVQYDYYDFNEDQYKHAVSVDELMSDADDEDERSVRAFNRRRCKPNFARMKRAYMRAIAEDFVASIKPPYSDLDGCMFDDPGTPLSVRRDRTPSSVIMSPPSVERKHLTILSPAAHSRLTTPLRQPTPQPVPLQQQPQQQQPQLQPVVPKIVIHTPLAPPVPAQPVQDKKPFVMDLKTKMKRYRMEQHAAALAQQQQEQQLQPEPINNENINSDHKVPPMKISRFNVDSIASTSTTPISITIKAPQNIDETQNERKVQQPLKLGLKVPSLKISLKKPEAPPVSVENGTSHTEIEERSGKKKRKEKDKKKKHKERDKEKHVEKEAEREQEILKLPILVKEPVVKEKEKEKEKEKTKESKKDKKKKKKHRSDENQAAPQNNGFLDCLPTTSVIVKPSQPAESPSPAGPVKVPKIKFRLPPQESMNTPTPVLPPRPSSAETSSAERPNGVIGPIKIRLSKKLPPAPSAERDFKDSEIAQPIATAPHPPEILPSQQRHSDEQQMAKAEKRKEKKEKKKEKEGGGLKLKIKRLVPPSEESTPIAPPAPHRKEKDRSAKKEKSSKKQEASLLAAAMHNSASSMGGLAAPTTSATNHSSPFLAQEPPAVEQSCPPLRVRIRPRQMPPAPSSQSQTIQQPIPPPSVFPPSALNIDPATAASYSINSMLINTITASFNKQKGSFSPNCSDEEPESELRHRTDDLISRLTSNPKACAQNSS